MKTVIIVECEEPSIWVKTVTDMIGGRAKVRVLSVEDLKMVLSRPELAPPEAVVCLTGFQLPLAERVAHTFSQARVLVLTGDGANRPVVIQKAEWPGQKAFLVLLGLDE